MYQEVVRVRLACVCLVVGCWLALTTVLVLLMIISRSVASLMWFRLTVIVNDDLINTKDCKSPGNLTTEGGLQLVRLGIGDDTTRKSNGEGVRSAGCGLKDGRWFRRIDCVV